MTVFIGGAVGWLFFVAGLICWYAELLGMAIPLMVGAYLCESYSSHIVISQNNRAMRHAVEVIQRMKGGRQ